jgi:hypothetical protein
MPINDDEDVEIMLILLQSTPMLNVAELYIEVESLIVGIVMQFPKVERIAQSLPETLTPVEECVLALKLTIFHTYQMNILMILSSQRG